MMTRLVQNIRRHWIIWSVDRGPLTDPSSVRRALLAKRLHHTTVSSDQLSLAVHTDREVQHQVVKTRTIHRAQHQRTINQHLRPLTNVKHRCCLRRIEHSIVHHLQTLQWTRSVLRNKPKQLEQLARSCHVTLAASHSSQ